MPHEATNSMLASLELNITRFQSFNEGVQGQLP